MRFCLFGTVLDPGHELFEVLDFSQRTVAIGERGGDWADFFRVDLSLLGLLYFGQGWVLQLNFLSLLLRLREEGIGELRDLGNGSLLHGNGERQASH